MSPEDAMLVFQMDPGKVRVNDSSRFHQYRWEVERWGDGRPTKEQAPLAFRIEGGFIMVDGQRWVEQGRNPRDILVP